MSAEIIKVEQEYIDPLVAANNHYQMMATFVKQQMQQGVDFGIVPGTNNKPVLLKPGAEKLCRLFNLYPQLELVQSIADFDKPLFHYHYRCTIYRHGEPIGQGEGCCNSREKKYEKQQYRVYDLVNTITKIAQKRCLSASTPVLVKTSRGVYRTKLDGLYALYQNENENLYLPGTDGSWRFVKAMTKEENRFVYRIDLADGSYIRATSEHRFPTSLGLKSVEQLEVGDILVRAQIPFEKTDKTWTEIGWVVGLFIAEGNFSSTFGSNGVRFTLNSNRTDLLERIRGIADFLGATVGVVPKKGEKAIALTIAGAQFKGLLEHFILGETSYTKHLSKNAWRQGREFLLQVLEGYLQGDGCWTNDKNRKHQPYWRIGFTGKNREWAEDLRSICAILGYRINLKRSKANCKGIEFPTFEGWIKTKAPKYNGKPLEKIVGITSDAKPSTVYDIEVDGNHLFCLANGIQTHNSMIAAVLVAVGGSDLFTQDLEDNIEQPYRSQAQPGNKINELIDQTTTEVNRLGWTNAQARLYLQENFNKSNRTLLTETELLRFLEQLKSL